MYKKEVNEKELIEIKEIKSSDKYFSEQMSSENLHKDLCWS